MESSRRAVIDVGTNSVKLLVADVKGAEVMPVLERSRQTRLGRGFYRNHRLQAEPIRATVTAVSEYARRARDLGALAVRIIATSAARDAANPRDLLDPLESETGIRVEILSGQQEADWAFAGIRTDPRLHNAPLLMLDVGGGSTEFILGRGHVVHFRDSFKLGTVRLMETVPHTDPPEPEELENCRSWVRHFLFERVMPAIQSPLERERAAAHGDEVLLVGTGGTAAILARLELELSEYDRERIEQTRLSLPALRRRTDFLWSLPLEKRKDLPGLPAGRADVILTGAVIYEIVMETFGFQKLRVSTRGLRFAAVMR